MPNILKQPNGDIDYSKIFMGFAMASVIVIQSLQTWHIAEIKAQGEVNRVNFMDKDKVLKIESDIIARVVKLEDCCENK